MARLIVDLDNDDVCALVRILERASDEALARVQAYENTEGVVYDARYREEADRAHREMDLAERLLYWLSKDQKFVQG